MLLPQVAGGNKKKIDPTDPEGKRVLQKPDPSNPTKKVDEYVLGSPTRVLGFVMDNPKVNRLALKLIEARHPTWLGVGCVVHGLNLLCKDLCELNKAGQGPGTIPTVQLVRELSKIIGDCNAVREALHLAQAQKYGEVRGIASHCPTRFAILFKIALDLIRSEDAFTSLVQAGM